MAHYQRMGSRAAQAAYAASRPSRAPCTTKLMGGEGFSDSSLLLYHRTYPSTVTAAAIWR